MRQSALAPASDVKRATPPAPPAVLRRPGLSMITAVPILVVIITFLFWYLTWFGRRLSDGEMDRYLADTSVPHKTQHALSQLAERMERGDARVKRWYPELLRLVANKEPGLRLMSAWAMGQDNQSADFHEALKRLVRDPEPMVRWNAALALVRFGDVTGERELRLMLRPLALAAPTAGKVRFKVKQQDALERGSLVARIEPGNGGPSLEVRSPLAGQVAGRLSGDGAKVSAGDQIALVSPGERQVWESLRGLYLVGRPEDLPDVERLAVSGGSEGTRRQAALAAQAIRARAVIRRSSDR